VLEVACGTGYWTAAYAGAASRVLAFDTSLSALEIARAKDLPAGRVRFIEADARNLQEVEGAFDAGFAAFWVSHLPRRDLPGWLEAFHARLEPGASVVLVDNVFVPGVGGDLLSREGTDDTFKRRTLDDGTEHEIVKNYFTEAELRSVLAPRSDHLHLHVGTCFWWARYTSA
jgi:SAM-dependent methyltransferase